METAARVAVTTHWWLQSAARRLAALGIPDAGLEAEVLLRDVLGVDRAGLLSCLGSDLDPDAACRAEAMLARRLDRTPLAYLLGYSEFYGLRLRVTQSTLVPRQETELLVDLALERVAASAGRPVEVADVGTGSGAIAVAVAAHAPSARVHAIDVDPGALAVAAENVRVHGLTGRVTLGVGDLLDILPGPVDLIVSNPPYIPNAAMDGLAPEVLREPRIALDGGPDGLAVTRRLLARAPAYLRPFGRVVVEISPEQAQRAAALARRAFPDARVRVVPDLMGHDRAVCVDAP